MLDCSPNLALAVLSALLCEWVPWIGSIHCMCSCSAVLMEGLWRRAFLLSTEEGLISKSVTRLLSKSQHWVQKWPQHGMIGKGFINKPHPPKPTLATPSLLQEAWHRLTRCHKVTSAQLVAEEVGVSEASIWCWQQQMFQDGVPLHWARQTQTFLDHNVPNFIPADVWPPNSPDLNPIEHMCG